jgi:putative SOS response-associated peptidase YedK
VKAREAFSMCNWYEYDLAEWEVRELVKHYRLSGHGLREPTEVFANGPGVVVVDCGDERALERMLWGLSPWTEERWLINFRNPEFEPWKSLIENKARRCVVPATSFAGSGRDSRWQWFARHNRKPFMFAGVWTKWRGDRGTSGAPNVGEHRLYSIMTTEANAVVQPVDDVMPVILTTVAEVEQWLTGSVEEALALQRPAADDVIKLLAEEKKAA